MFKMKKAVSVVLASAMVVGSAMCVNAADAEIKVEINGEIQKYDQPPVLMNDRTLVPLRGIFEALGAAVSWDEATSGVTAVKDTTVVALQIGSKTAYVNNNEVTLDQEATLVNDRTMVPVRFVSEAMGAAVDWNDAENKVVIKTTQSGTSENKPADSKPAENIPEGSNPTETTPADSSNVKLGEELLPVPGAEEDVLLTGSWYGFANATIESVKDTVHSGKRAVKIVQRDINWHGVGTEDQALTDAISNAGSGKRYQIEAYVKTTECPMSVNLKLRIYTTDGGNFYLTTSAVASNTEWTKISTIGELSWQGDIKRVVLYTDNYDGIQGALQDYYVDDFSVKRVLD